MNAQEATIEFVSDLFDNYPETGNRKVPIVSGSYLEAIDDAKRLTQKKWLDFFGDEIPEDMAFPDYVLTLKRSTELRMLRHKIFYNLDNQTRLDLSEGGREDVSQVTYRAAKMRRDVYLSSLSFDDHSPEFQLQEQLISGYPIQTAFSRRRNTQSDKDCAITVFGMAAVRLVDTPDSPKDYFDSAIARMVVEGHSDRGSRFDLPWLLGSLTTEHAALKSGLKVRNIITVGADFGEIQDKVIDPIKKKIPDVGFLLNVVLGSETSTLANHAVNVVGSNPGESLSVLDPKYTGVINLPLEDFWDRWVLANMQSVVSVVEEL